MQIIFTKMKFRVFCKRSNVAFNSLFQYSRNYNLRSVSYMQGQEPEPKIREYFYYIDHQGMLFLDDSKMKNFTSCFKDKKFLQFFFKRLKLNNTERYKNDFPYISLCGRERNFIRCDDVPIVYTNIVKQQVEGNDINLLSFAHAGELLVCPFQPEKIFMFTKSGRVYHPTEGKYGGIGLIMSKLAIEFSKNFEFDNGDNEPPTSFTWEGKKYCLDQEWFDITRTKNGINVKEVM